MHINITKQIKGYFCRHIICTPVAMGQNEVLRNEANILQTEGFIKMADFRLHKCHTTCV